MSSLPASSARPVIARTAQAPTLSVVPTMCFIFLSPSPAPGRDLRGPGPEHLPLPLGHRCYAQCRVSASGRARAESRLRKDLGPVRVPGWYRPRAYGNDGALILPEQPRCSIVAVSAAGRPAVPGCGAGARDWWGMRESGGGGRPGGGHRPARGHRPGRGHRPARGHRLARAPARARAPAGRGYRPGRRPGLAEARTGSGPRSRPVAPDGPAIRGPARLTSRSKAPMSKAKKGEGNVWNHCRSRRFRPFEAGSGMGYEGSGCPPRAADGDCRP